MKKKVICFIVIAVLAISAIVYFKPLSFSDIADSGNDIQMILTNFAIENGEPYNETVEYTNITPEQKSKILTVFEKHSYKRNFKTLFSDGSISDLGDKLLNIYVYEDGLHGDTVMISSSGKMIVNDKAYSIKNAESFIEEIVYILN